MTTRKIGAQGESFAAQILQKRGMEILLRNYYTPYGEIDLIVRDGGYIAFVEVKTRRAGSLSVRQKPWTGASKKESSSRLYIT